MKKILLACIFAACGFTFAQDAPKQAAPEAAKPGPQKEGRPQRRPGMRQNGPRMDMVARVDNEMKEIIAQYDLDKDGKFSPEERAAADKDLDMETLQLKLRKARMYDMFKAIDADGDLKISDEEKANAAEKLMELNKSRMPQQGPRGPRGPREGAQRRNQGPKKGGDKPQPPAPAPAE